MAGKNTRNHQLQLIALPGSPGGRLIVTTAVQYDDPHEQTVGYFLPIWWRHPDIYIYIRYITASLPCRGKVNSFSLPLRPPCSCRHVFEILSQHSYKRQTRLRPVLWMPYFRYRAPGTYWVVGLRSIVASVIFPTRPSAATRYCWITQPLTTRSFRLFENSMCLVGPFS